MKLYDSNEKFCHCNMKSSLAKDMTISFLINLKECLECDYKLIEKEGEFLVKLSKKRKIYFYVADNNNVMKIQVKSDVLSGCGTMNVSIVRNTECKRTVIYVNGVVNAVTCMEEEFIEMGKSCGDVNYYFGGECAEYEMKQLEIFNDASNFDEIKDRIAFDSCDKKMLWEQIYCKMYETYRFEDNLYYYIMTPDGVVFFPNESKYGNNSLTPATTYTQSTKKNQYMEFVYRYYNVEQNEKCLPLDGLKVIQYEDLCEHFDVDRFVTNLVTWQFLDKDAAFQKAHPKGIDPNGAIGYWSADLGLTPFTPYLGNETVGLVATHAGNLKNGFVVSFIKLLINQYLTTQNAIYRTSLSDLIDYLIALPGTGTGAIHNTNFGIPDQYTQTATSPINLNAGLTSLHQGNYLNYLKIVDVIINNACVRNFVDDSRIAELNNNYVSVMNLLLALQVQSSGRLTIWSEYYTGNATSATNVATDLTLSAFIPNATPNLTVPESVEILLYLMNVSCPTADQKKSIKNGVEWLKLNQLNSYAQYFDDKLKKMVITPFNYVDTPDKLILHSHYYTTAGYPIGADAVIPAMGAVFYDTVNGAIHSTLAPSPFPANFNNEIFDTQVDQFGTWAQCAVSVYDEWVKVYDSPCGPVAGCMQCKSYKSCKSCKHC